jgi:hypothetical protein
LIDFNIFSLLDRLLLWYKMNCPAVRVMRHPGFEPTLFKGVPTYHYDAIGSGQGGVLEEEPNLRRQVQNFAAHGTVGFSNASTGDVKT